MSLIRRHTCVEEPPGSSAVPLVRKGFNRPRRVLSSDSELRKTENVTMSGRVASAQQLKHQAVSTVHRPNVRRNITRKPARPIQTSLRTHSMSGGDVSTVKRLALKTKITKRISSTENVGSKELKDTQCSQESKVVHQTAICSDVDNNDNSYLASPDRKPTLRELYKNNNFKSSPGHISAQVHRNLSSTSIEKRFLDTITENSETTRGCCSSKSTSAEKCPLLRSTVQLKNLLELDRPNEVTNVSEFRKKHFFECHSAEAMLSQRASALRDPDHKCNYVFYLNERLFPVPLYSDMHNNIRCSECSLPMPSELANKNSTPSFDETLNATIQAKVKVGSDNKLKDVIITVPAKNSLLVLEKNRNVKELLADDVLHFGILQIDNRRSAFVGNRAPENSFALRYQKGYREYTDGEDLAISGYMKGEVIYV